MISRLRHSPRLIALFTTLLLFANGANAAQPLQIQELAADSEIKGQVAARAEAPSHRPANLTSAPAPLGQGYGGEVEPNGTTGTASLLTGTNFVVRAPLFPAGDIDFYTFSGTAGDRLYLALMTSASAGNSTDSQLTLLDTDGTTVIEFDDDNGSLAGLSSSIAGAILPSTGTFFIKVNDFTAGTASERPYELHFRLQSASDTPTPEVEANDTPGTANPLPANGWVSGARNPALAAEQDWYSLALNAGDTVYLSLDVDPEDDLVVWNGRLGFGLFGDAGNQILVVDDAGTGDISPLPNRPSEALFLTVKTAGTYFAFVDSATAATGGPTATYHLSVSVHPATNQGVNCTTYTSTNVPQTIGPAAGLVSSTITVPGNPRIADLDVEIILNHTVMGQIDAHLRSPAGNDMGLFTDVGAAAAGGQAQMDLVLNDEAGAPFSFTVVKGIQVKPEVAYRLAWLDGEDAGGVWTLDLRDDTGDANGGTLTGWSLRICEPAPPPACLVGFTPVTVFTTDFEGGAAGFTHSGTADEWELGLPATVATSTTNPIAGFNTCNSGVSCWKTDLDGTYDISSTQDLLSPSIDLTGLSAPVVVTWAQKYQMENATFDHMFVDFQQVGGATPVRLFEHHDATMTDGPGNPTVNIGASSGWSVHSRRADSLAGLLTEARFHVDSDNTVVFAGMAIDDVTVTACEPLPVVNADVAITKTDGSATEVPGTTVTYTIVASNAGPNPAPTVTVADNFPAALSNCSTTCTASAGSTCTAGPVAGNLNDVANLLVTGTATYTATCDVSPTAIGALSNTATATVGGPEVDPATGDNTATDNDTLVPTADVTITKTNGVTQSTPGLPVTYTIVVTNAGPSAAPTVTVLDLFPATLTSCATTCVGAGGGTCTAGPVVGNINENANLPVGGSATYTASCTLSLSATGNLANTATATVGGGATDPNTADNSATDTDTVGNTIFNDGFESGDTLLWSVTVPLTVEAYAVVGVDAATSAATFDYDFSAVKSGEELMATAIAVVQDASGKPLFVLGARRTESFGELEIALQFPGAGRSRWVPVSEVGQRVRIEWSLADLASLGRASVALDGLVVLRIEGYAGTASPAGAQLLRSRQAPTEP